MSRRPQFESTRTAAQGEPVTLGTLAIVGRPNVGKSTLFNRLVGSRRAIVGDEPGITRDRLYGDVEWVGKKFRVVDTGGIVPDDQALIPSEIFRQARVALEQADVIVLVVDGRTELASPDIDLARLLLRTGKPLLLAVNKADTPQLEPYAEEFRRLGIKRTVSHLRGKWQRHCRIIRARLERDAGARDGGERSQLSNASSEQTLGTAPASGS